MTIRTLLITASVAAMLAIPTAAEAQVLTAPVVSGTNATTTIAKLQFQLLQAKHRAATLQARSRAAESRAAHMQTKLDAAKSRAADLQSNLYAAQFRAASAQAELDAVKNGKPWPPAPTPVDTCQSSMVDCTTQQLCDDWGIDCNLIPATPADAEKPASTDTN